MPDEPKTFGPDDVSDEEVERLDPWDDGPPTTARHGENHTRRPVKTEAGRDQGAAEEAAPPPPRRPLPVRHHGRHRRHQHDAGKTRPERDADHRHHVNRCGWAFRL